MEDLSEEMGNVCGEMENCVTDLNQKETKTDRLEQDLDGLQMLRLVQEDDKALLTSLLAQESEESKDPNAVLEESPQEGDHIMHDRKCFQISNPLVQVDHTRIKQDNRVEEEIVADDVEIVFDQNSGTQRASEQDMGTGRREKLKGLEGAGADRKSALVNKLLHDLDERQQKFLQDLHVKFVLEGVDVEEDDEARARKHSEFVELKKRLEEEEKMYAGCALGDASEIHAIDKDQVEADSVIATIDGVINSLADVAICSSDSTQRDCLKQLPLLPNIRNEIKTLAEDVGLLELQEHTDRESSEEFHCCRKAGKQIDEGDDDDAHATHSYSVLNIVCPVSGIPVTDLEDPVRSEDCEHIYDRASALNYITTMAKDGVCLCASSGCRAQLAEHKMVASSRLWQDIEELRQIKTAMWESRMMQDMADMDDSDDD